MLPGYSNFILSVLDAYIWPGPGCSATGRRRRYPGPAGPDRAGSAILDRNLAYGAWRAGGLHITDVGGEKPEPVGSLPARGVGGGNTRTTLPLPGRGLVVLADGAVEDMGRTATAGCG